MSLKIADSFSTKEAKLAETILDMYKGEQEEHLIEILNCPNKGRKDWLSRGIIPRTRNIMKMIVDKSGMLFNDKAPVLNVYTDRTAVANDDAATLKLKDQLEDCNWIEFFTNFDSVLRILRTALVLVQYNSEEKNLVLDILTQHNCVVAEKNGRIDTVIYQTSEEGKFKQFRVFTKELIQDIEVNTDTHEEIITSSLPNPFGIIPVASFHDTNTPIFDFWNVIPTDLLQVNDIYNLHITDSEYAASWSKLQTLFTNCKIITSEDMQMELIAPYGSSLPRLAPSQGALIGGPSRVIQIDTMGVDNPFIEYKGPVVDLEPLDNIINKWVSDFAADWCVNVKMAGQGSADSGFKLIVEEMDNLELRKKRAKMFEAGFARLFDIIKQVVNTYSPGYYTDDSICQAKFSAPNLPVDIKLQEEVWSRRIAEGRASRTMYFMEVHGLSKEEAEEKIKEIDGERPALAAPRTLQITKQTGVNA
jgi:hypothetical protein